MVEIIKIKKNYLVKSDRYCVKINNSGTIRGMSFNGIDTGLRREGCEYWIANGIHFEQEFGGILNFLQSRSKVEINATVKTPRNRKNGGTCTTKYSFKKDSIVIESELFPLYEMKSYDKYACFKRKKYTHYSFNGDEFKKIDKRRIKESDSKKIILKNGDKNIMITCLSSIKQMRIYRTKSMIEVKPEWDNPVMKVEYKIYERENRTENISD